jgi:hypothetical protein
MAALNMMDPANYYYRSYRHQIEPQQNSSCLSVQEQCIRSGRGFMKRQPIRPIPRRACKVAHSNAYYNILNVAHQHGALLQQEQPTLPYPSIRGPIASAVTSVRSNTAYSAGFCSGTTSRLASSSHSHLPAALPSQASHHPPGPVPQARPEEKETHVAPPRVSISPHLSKFHIMWM